MYACFFWGGVKGGCFPLVKSVYWGLFVRLGLGMRWGIHKAHRGTAIPMATVCQVGGLRVQLPCRSLEMQKKRECEHKKGKRRQKRAREAFCLSALDKTKTTHSSGFMPDFFIHKQAAGCKATIKQLQGLC